MKDDREIYTVGTKTVCGTRKAARMAYDAGLPAIDSQGLTYEPALECCTWGRKMLFHPVFAPKGMVHV